MSAVSSSAGMSIQPASSAVDAVRAPLDEVAISQHIAENEPSSGNWVRTATAPVAGSTFREFWG